MSKSYKCNLILTPASKKDQALFEKSICALYVLYKNENSDEIQIGIPGLIKYSELHNMDNFEEAKEKAYFLNLGYSGLDVLELITDRPVYMIEPSINRTVKKYNIINGINIELNDILKPQKTLKLK